MIARNEGEPSRIKPEVRSIETLGIDEIARRTGKEVNEYGGKRYIEYGGAFIIATTVEENSITREDLMIQLNRMGEGNIEQNLSHTVAVIDNDTITFVDPIRPPSYDGIWPTITGVEVSNKGALLFARKNYTEEMWDAAEIALERYRKFVGMK